jgi:chromosome segregation ATPase
MDNDNHDHNLNYNYTGRQFDEFTLSDRKYKDSKRDDIISLDSVKNSPTRYILSEENENEENYTPGVSGNEETKLRMQIMEKDKIIFEYSRILKETERVLDNTKKSNLAKDETIIKLKDEQKDLKFRLKNVENILNKREEDFEKYKHVTEEKVLQLSKEKKILQDKLDEMARIMEGSQNDFQNTFVEYKKIEKQLLKMNKHLEEKNEALNSYERVIEDLRKENKMIPMWKKQFGDLEAYNDELKKEVNSGKMLLEKAQADKEDLESKIAYLLNENRGEKETAKNYTKLTFDIDFKNKELDDKDREISGLTERYKNVLRENDNFSSIITNEIISLTNEFENIFSSGKVYNFSKMPIKINLNSSQSNLKYELLNKNIEELKRKVLEYYNQSVSQIDKFQFNSSELERQYKNVLNERDVLTKDNTLTGQKIKDLLEKNEELYSDNEKLSESFNKLKESYNGLKYDHESLIRRNTDLMSDMESFLNNCYFKLKEKYPDMSLGDDEYTSNSDKIVSSLDALLNDYKKALYKERDLEDQLNKANMLIESLEKEKDLYKTRIDRILTVKDEEMKQFEEIKAQDLFKQREILYEKINQVRWNFNPFS